MLNLIFLLFFNGSVLSGQRPVLTHNIHFCTYYRGFRKRSNQSNFILETNNSVVCSSQTSLLIDLSFIFPLLVCCQWCFWNITIMHAVSYSFFLFLCILLLYITVVIAYVFICLFHFFACSSNVFALPHKYVWT